MRILKLSPYYFPEQVSSSHLTKDLTAAFITNGITIENYVPTPTRGVTDEVRRKYKKIKYEEQEEGKIIIHRFSMFAEKKNNIQRAFRYILVNFIQYIKGSHAKNIDLIYAGSTPPTQGMLCGLVKKRLNVPFVYNLQDIFPDSLVNAKMTKKGSIIWKIGRRIENFTYRSADKIIVISEDFKRNIIKKGVPEDKIVVIPNWVNTNDVYPVERKDNVLFDRYGFDRSKFYVCYSGNLGHSQNLELLVKVAEEIQISMPNVFFVLFGEGIAKEELKAVVEKKKLDNIVILSFQPYEDIAHVFSFGDVGLIISKSGIGKSSVPSKTWGIMAAERPILASFDRNSELAEILIKTNSGIVTDTNSVESFVNAIRFLYENNDVRNEWGINGKNYVNKVVNKEICTKKYIDLVKECIETKHGRI